MVAYFSLFIFSGLMKKACDCVTLALRRPLLRTVASRDGGFDLQRFITGIDPLTLTLLTWVGPMRAAIC